MRVWSSLSPMSSRQGWRTGACIAAFVATCVASDVLPLHGQATSGLSRVDRAAAGFDDAPLQAATAVLQKHVDEHKVAGAVAMAARHGQLGYVAAVGYQDIEQRVPMTERTLFRIYSMTKPVTAVAVMMLVEQGRLQLDDPVAKYLPEFSTVVVRDASGATHPPARAITIRDLLLHISGLEHRTSALYRDAQVRSRSIDLSQFVRNIVRVPLMDEPGVRYRYSESTTVLGRLVEVVSGQTFDVFLQTRIFTPLKMVDTGFFATPAQRPRLATVYTPKEDGTIQRAPDTAPMTMNGMVAQGAYVDGPRQCFAGGAGLLSTAPDYARLARMFASGGALDGVRILSPKTVQLMTSNFVGNLNNDGRTGFGLGFEVVEHMGRSGRYGSPGAFGWGAAYYANYWVDPQEDMVGLYFSQFLPYTINDLQATAGRYLGAERAERAQ